jgi:hypothetical protein
VAELVDAHDSKSCLARGEGSIPSFGTSERSELGRRASQLLGLREGIEKVEHMLLDSCRVACETCTVPVGKDSLLRHKTNEVSLVTKRNVLMYIS